MPVNGTGTAVIQARAIPNSETNGMSNGGGGTNSTLQNPGNPTPLGLFFDTEFAPDKLPCIIYTAIHQNSTTTNDNPAGVESQVHFDCGLVFGRRWENPLDALD